MPSERGALSDLWACGNVDELSPLPQEAPQSFPPIHYGRVRSLGARARVRVVVGSRDECGCIELEP